MRCETCLRKVPITGHCRRCHAVKFPSVWSGDDPGVERDLIFHKIRMKMVRLIKWAI